MSILSSTEMSKHTFDQFQIGNKENSLYKEDGTPLIKEIPNFLSEDECNNLIQFANERGFEKPNFGKSRICERLHTVNEDLSSWVMTRLREYLPEVINIDGARWRLSRFTHHWRYVHYNPGGHFSPHYDGSKMLPWKEMSVFTVQIYLNEGFSGGSTRFYMDHLPDRMIPRQVEYGKVKQFDLKNKSTHKIKPKIGKALVFNHTENTLHDGKPVEEGEKYILRGDVFYRAFEEDYSLLENSTLPPELRMWSNEAAERGDTKSYIGEIWHCQCGDDLCGVKKIPAPSDLSIRTNILSPMRVILLSGKRASGKDYIANKIQQSFEKLNWKVHRTSLGILNKQIYAKKHHIDVNRLEKDRCFKEEHRLAMIRHHTDMDKLNPEWAVESVLQSAEDEKADILLVSDIRRLKDLEWFQKNSPINPILLRIDADNESRLQRGWDPNPEKDQLPTEVELDEYQAWTSRFDNSVSNDEGKKVDDWIRSSVVLPIVLELSCSDDKNS